MIALSDLSLNSTSVPEPLSGATSSRRASKPLRGPDLLRLHDFQVPNLPQQVPDLLKIRRITVTLADRPVIVLPDEIQFVGALLDANTRDIVDRKIRQQFPAGAPLPGRLVGSRVAPGDIEAQRADDRSQDNQNAELFSIHFAAVLLRL